MYFEGKLKEAKFHLEFQRLKAKKEEWLTISEDKMKQAKFPKFL